MVIGGATVLEILLVRQVVELGIMPADCVLVPAEVFSTSNLIVWAVSAVELRNLLQISTTFTVSLAPMPESSIANRSSSLTVVEPL